MANLNEILENANGGEAIPILGQELGLTPEQTQSAITALLPAISSGLKQSTSSVDGLGNLFALMGQQKDLPGLFEDAKTALSPDGLAAGNQALSLIFGSQEASQAIVDQAQKFSGVSSSVLDKMLPALTGIAVSGLMRSGSPATAPLGGAQGALSPFGAGGGLGDILGQVFGRVLTGGAAPALLPRPPPEALARSAISLDRYLDKGRDRGARRLQLRRVRRFQVPPTQAAARRRRAAIFSA